ncbi:MAG TPA: DUF1800 family protein [Blastocatellia bacterium]|nr:DUF1800 family protein [Blastocatellia bacterium]
MKVRRTVFLAPILLMTLLAVAFGAGPGVTMTMSPTSATIVVGGSQVLTAQISGSPATAVTWTVNGVLGGNDAVGRINSSGKYVAPSQLVPGGTVTVKAVSAANPSVSATCAITIRNPIPALNSVTPGQVTMGSFVLTLTGKSFIKGAQVRWNGSALATTFVSSTKLTASGSAGAAGPASITVANPGPAAVSSASTVTVTAPITVAVTPQGVDVPPSGQQQFQAMVTGSDNHSVTWNVNGKGSGSTTDGTITAGGLYTAPSVAPSSGRVIIVAVSNADGVSHGTAAAIIVASAISVAVTPTSASLSPSGQQQFQAVVTGSANQTVTWKVNGVAGGDASDGTITSGGLYTAPSVPPSSGTITITAVSAADGVTQGTGSVTINAVSAISVTVSPNSASLAPSGQQQFQAVVTGTANQAVTWRVNGVMGGDASDGTITSGGLYTAPSVPPSSGTITITAVSVADGVTQGIASVTMSVAPDPLAITYGRFLEQATFGPTPQTLAEVRQSGIPAFIEQQFTIPESPWPNLATATRGDAVDSFFGNAASGQDQLRQRVIFALSEILVIAMNKNTNGDEIVPWLQLLSRNAFGNYRTLLREITLDATMGEYLDLANSAKPGVDGGANENYPRECMQLFSIGLNQLNLDGSTKLDGQGQPIPTYTQTDVQQLARALTGWTYGNASGVPPANPNPNPFPGPMLPIESRHDTTAKTILGQPLPAGQTTTQDLDGALDVIFNHPNVGPFVATRLIRALVTSNPSPAYITHVASAFNDNGQGVRGDMKAVIRAVLLDPEARNDSPPSNFGRLRTPMQHTIAMIRALNIPPGPASNFGYLFYGMGEGMLDAPSVFGHYSPFFHVPTTGLFGPEFQIYTPSEAINRANFLYSFMPSPWPINPALQPLVDIAGNPAALITAVDNTLLYGRMTPAMRTEILNAMPAAFDNNQRVMTALYLTVMSGDYLIQH